MIKSMTGFGKASHNAGNKTISVEVRSLNNKSADINLKIPSSLRNHENEFRNEISKTLERGKIDLNVSIENKNSGSSHEINLEIAREYHRQIKSMCIELRLPQKNLMREILRMPELFKGNKLDADEHDLKHIKKCIHDALAELNHFRAEEGKALQKDLNERIKKINSSLNEISKLDESRIDSIKSKLKKNISEIIGKEKIDNNRLEQELIFYVEKLDINEEKVRLKTHLDYFSQTMKENSSGRKLNFISQEIGREINTIGSKANNAQIQKLVVEMKDELEKIKEQTNNVL